MANINKLSRRDFLTHALRGGAALGLTALTQVPPFAQRAMAEGSIGLNGKKLLFIFLRGANDALNSAIPVLDPAYNTTIRPTVYVPADAGIDYSTTGPADFPTGLASTFEYATAIKLGNGFTGLHPRLKFLAPVYNAGDLAMIHRVGYPRQSRSHFNSQAYWETGIPGTTSREGFLYRTLLESPAAATNPLLGVSLQSRLPVLFKGPEMAITNLSDPTRYDLLGTPTPEADQKLVEAIITSNQASFADKRNRDLLSLSYINLVNTLDLFSAIDFNENATAGDPSRPGNHYVDDVDSDGPGSSPYHLFPTQNAKNGGGTPASYVVNAGAYNFFRQLKSAALVLNHTDAVIAGTEAVGFDTHNNQGSITGRHADLQTQIAWAIYGLRKFFTLYNDRVDWNNLVVVTLTEFGRTTVQNSNNGTDHAEAGLMWAAGGGVKGSGKGGRVHGLIGGHPGDSIPWITGNAGSMFGVAGRYLKRAVDYRSVLGEIIREHLGATPEQLNRIIPGYGIPGEALIGGGTSSVDGTPIMGEVDII